VCEDSTCVPPKPAAEERGAPKMPEVGAALRPEVRGDPCASAKSSEATGFIHRPSGIEMVELPGREGFALGRYEVTNSQYARFLTAHGGNGCGGRRCVDLDVDDCRGREHGIRRVDLVFLGL